MALNPSDPRYRAEVVPTSIAAMGAPLCAAYGVGADAFGNKGNLLHTSGYHRSRNWVLYSPDSVYGSRDYSVQLDADRHGDPDLISAFDFTPGTWGTPDNRAKMIVITKRMRAAALAHDARVADLREFAGTEDGRNVVTIDMRTGGDRTPFDPSHLDHGHGSFYRSAAANNHQGIVDVMLGRGSTTPTEDDDMALSNITIPPAGQWTSVSIAAGGANKAQCYFAMDNDTGDMQGVAHDYGVRVYYSGGNGWAALGPNGGLFKGRNGVVTSCPFPGLDKLPDGVRGVSVMRAPLDAKGNVVDPKSPAAAGLPVYDGPLTFAIEMQH